MSKLVILGFLYCYFGYMNTSWGWCIWLFLQLTFGCNETSSGGACSSVLIIRKAWHDSLGLDIWLLGHLNQGRWTLLQLDWQKMAPSPVIGIPMIIPVSDPLVSADSWTLYMGKWDHIFKSSGEKTKGSHLQCITCLEVLLKGRKVWRLLSTKSSKRALETDYICL